MLGEGADIVEIGGESTGPNSKDVSPEEERSRALPVLIEARKRWADLPISIDTAKSTIAKEALDAGAAMINDVTAGRGDSAMFQVVAVHPSKPKLVLMHAKDSASRTTIEARHYDDVMGTVIEFLEKQIEIALEAGVQRSQIILDPGLGHFLSSEAKYSYTILAQLSRLAALGFPILVSPSRKSFLAGPENLKASDRLAGTIAASAIAILNGAHSIRTHDVAEVRRGCEVAAALLDAVSLPSPRSGKRAMSNEQ